VKHPISIESCTMTSYIVFNLENDENNGDDDKDYHGEFRMEMKKRNKKMNIEISWIDI